MLGRRAGSPFAVYVIVQVQCREPKTGQEKVHFYCEDDSSYYLSMCETIVKKCNRMPFRFSLKCYVKQNLV